MSTTIILNEFQSTQFYTDNLTKLKGLAIQLLAGDCSAKQRAQLAVNFKQLQSALHNNLETIIFCLENKEGGE